MKAVQLAMALAVVLVVVTGCVSQVSTRGFTFQATPDANDWSPVAVEVVILQDAALLETVGSLTARGWFQARDQLERDHPGGFRALRWELVPGQELEVVSPFRDRRGIAVFVFADYLTPGAHRVRVEDRRRFTLVLGREGFSMVDGR